MQAVSKSSSAASTDAQTVAQTSCGPPYLGADVLQATAGRHHARVVDHHIDVRRQRRHLGRPAGNGCAQGEQQVGTRWLDGRRRCQRRPPSAAPPAVGLVPGPVSVWPAACSAAHSLTTSQWRAGWRCRQSSAALVLGARRQRRVTAGISRSSRPLTATAAARQACSTCRERAHLHVGQDLQLLGLRRLPAPGGARQGAEGAGGRRGVGRDELRGAARNRRHALLLQPARARSSQPQPQACRHLQAAMTLFPFATKWRTNSAPIPREPPTTTTVLPLMGPTETAAMAGWSERRRGLRQWHGEGGGGGGEQGGGGQPMPTQPRNCFCCTGHPAPHWAWHAWLGWGQRGQGCKGSNAP